MAGLIKKAVGILRGQRSNPTPTPERSESLPPVQPWSQTRDAQQPSASKKGAPMGGLPSRGLPNVAPMATGASPKASGEDGFFEVYRFDGGAGQRPLAKPPHTAQPAIRPVAPANFYVGGGYGGALAQASSYFPQAPRASASEERERKRPRLAGSCAAEPLVIDDDEPAAAPHAAPRRLEAQKRAVAEARLLGPASGEAVDEVIVESELVWIGSRKAKACCLTLTADSVKLWAAFSDEDELTYDIPLSMVHRVGLSFSLQTTDTWPAGWMGLLVLDVKHLMESKLSGYFNPDSHDPQESCFCCLMMENNHTAQINRDILDNLFPWRGKWQKISAEEHDDLTAGRRAQLQPRMTQRQRAHCVRQEFAASPPPVAEAALPKLQTAVVYPPDDPDAVTLHNSDLRRLAPGEYLNDNLVDFCLKQLAAQLSADARRRFHFFNCFFFKKLAVAPEEDTPPPRPPTQLERCAVAHERVCKWTSRFDALAMDFLVIPVNQSLHWTLAIVCHPGAAQRLLKKPPTHGGDAADDAIELGKEEEEEEPEGGRPCPVILQLDSMGSSHRNVEGVVRGWLASEWALRRGVTLEEGMAIYGPSGPMRFIAAEVPQQENSFDCGLFVAEFARRFCMAAPTPFLSTREADGWPYMLKRDWFSGSAAGQRKREHIHKSILALAGLVAQPQPLDDHAAEGTIVVD